MLYSALPLAFVSLLSIDPDHLSLTVALSIFPLSDVRIIVTPASFTEAVAEAVFPAAFVKAFLVPLASSFPMSFL